MESANRGLIALPNDELLNYLSSQMRIKFNKAVLIGSTSVSSIALKKLLESTSTLHYDDVKKFIFNEDLVESAYFDDAGVFTAIVNLSNDESYNMHLYAVGLFSEDRLVGTIARTPIIYLNSKIGGKFPIKIPIKGTSGEVVFRSSEYLTVTEAEERFLSPVISSMSLSIGTIHGLIENEIKKIGVD